MIAVSFICGLVFVSIGVIAFLALTAPVGYEDERGFHFGDPKGYEFPVTPSATHGSDWARESVCSTASRKQSNVVSFRHAEGDAR